MTVTTENPTTSTDLRYLPAFVYGTLRVGEGNWSWAIQGRSTSEQVALLSGARMFDANSGFPYVTMSDSAESDIVVGDLIHIDPAQFGSVMRDLDGLEGFRGEGNRTNLYDRKIVTVTTETGEQVEAYTYLVASDIYERRVRNYPTIPGGDWLDHIAARGPRY